MELASESCTAQGEVSFCRDWELFASLEPAELQDSIENRKAEEKVRFSQSILHWEKNWALYSIYLSISILGKDKMWGSEGTAQIILSSWYLQERSRWAALLGSDQPASLQSLPLSQVWPKATEGAARGEEPLTNAVIMSMPCGKISQGKSWLCPLVVLRQIQADSQDDKPWTHFYCTPMKLMLKISVIAQPEDSLT